MASVREGPVLASASLRERIRSADLVVFNCESLVSDRPFIGALVFVMSQAFLERCLEALGIDPAKTIVSVANNHIHDRGPAGCEELIGRLEGLGLTPIGARAGNRTPIVTIERHGLRLGFSAWTEWMNRDRHPALCSVWRPKTIDEAVAASTSTCDTLIGFPHWDYEFCHFPTAATVARAHRLIDEGFSLLVGHHPHVLQPIEKRGSGFCQYSLGNLTPMPARIAHWATMLGAMLEVRLAGSSSVHPGRVTAYDVVPIFEIRTGRSLALREVEELPARLRAKIDRRLALLFPPRQVAR
ncbi:MAG: CapA family protein [Candidatus Bipolaricaulota bacterium]|nr:MAG: CapA family protein [Candidatus Bipolaricaulota bacterium]